MALTRVSRHIIDEPFNPTTVSATDVTATNINASGIGTVGTLRVTGDLTVEGTTTTLDSILTEVDRLEVSANSNVAAGIITQTGGGDILNLFDGSTEVFTVKDGGNIGIGSETPGATLDIAKTTPVIRFTDTDAGQYAEILNSGSSFYISADRGNGGNGDIIFRSGGTAEKVRITSDGEVGIGTNNPTNTLEISKVDNHGITLRRPAGGTNPGAVKFEVHSNGAGRLVSERDFNINFNTDDLGNQYFNVSSNGSEKFRITSTGLVGIGTDSPDANIDVQRSGTGTIARFGIGDGTTSLDIKYSSNTTTFDQQHSKSIAFETGSAERLRIKSDGKVGIGTDDPDELLEVGDGTVSGALKVSGQSSSVTSDGFTVDWESSSNSTRFFSEPSSGGSSAIRFFTTSSGTRAEKLRITSGGNIGIGSDTPRYALDVHNNNILVSGSSAGTLILEDRGVGDSSRPFTLLASDGGDFKITNANRNASKVTTSSVERFRITGFGTCRLPDDGKLTLGAGDDLQIYHESSSSSNFISASPNFKLLTDTFRLNNAANNNNIIVADSGDGVDLYFNNSKKFETTNTGAKVTGALEVTQEYPSIRPTLDLNFAATKTLDRRITFTRDSIGTYTDDMGIIKYASSNVPRFDHDPATGESLGLLIEESRTNEIIYSRDLSYWDSAYGSSVEVVQTDTAIAPDGTQTADSMLGDGGSGRYTIRFSQTLATSTQFTFSVFVKKIQGVRYCSLETASYSTWSNSGIVVFDLDTGTLLSNSIGGSQGGGIEEYANGWYRIYGVSTTSTNGGNSGFYLNFALSDGGSTLNPGPATNEGLYVWGAQVEAGSFLTSYIPTSGDTVTRAQDSAKITGTNLTDFYNQPEGTIFADYKVIQSDPDIFYLSNGQSSRRIGLYEAGSSQTRFIIGNSGTQADTTDSSGTTVGDNIKSAGAYKLNDIVAAKNGVISSTDSSATIPDGIDRAYIGGYYEGTAEGVLGLRRLSYYNKRLPNAQLQGLTQQ